MEKSQDRLEILKKIEVYEQERQFDIDVENDPPAPMLMPNQVDYLNKKLSSKIATFYYDFLAKVFFEKQIKNHKLIIDKIIGIENFASIKGGAILTCNHFNAFDCYAIKKSIAPYTKKLYTVIREGNYTAFPGFYGKVFKHCRTLPLSSNKDTMKKFVGATDTLLKRGEKILIYPEQAMWWNYKKPRPLKNGGFNIAVRNNVPVIPFFITMEDSDILDNNGFFVQKYTIHCLSPIYPDPHLNKSENIARMKQQNYEVWKQTYEKTYGKKLEYSTKEN